MGIKSIYLTKNNVFDSIYNILLCIKLRRTQP